MARQLHYRPITMRYPLRPFVATFRMTAKSIECTLRTPQGDMWSVESGWTYGEVTTKVEGRAFQFGGEIIAWNNE